MKAWENYFKTMQDVVSTVLETQGEAIMKAAEILADTTEKGGIIYGFGTGHSHLVTDDAFWRAATPANYCALLEQSATGSFEITKSYYVENTYGIGKLIVDYHRITSDDCMIIISNSGNNIAPVDAAIRAKEKGIPVIAITAVTYSDFLKTKHKDGVKLKDVADVVLDNCSLIGDAAVDIEGFPMKVGSTSTIPNVFLQNAVLTQMVELLVQRGFEPDVYYNGHMAFMDENCADHNDKIVDKYFHRIRNL
ncbi:sugar isomerase domain-containing protein [Clostridiaceae bacterium DONG20-135]|uniref:Sugar isomerase domain-containing protein n=1 Tax=Copranaerobaculum intestinale TaxID=2692629 RepID=A0A6N8U645_9FIRM|nr:sugar isomerase domain-containing protein [Copranaerobaculum intestinale]MXQ73310.1 sugar isomerase domain-containing protein [Copranaerobaculum intestinale]